MWNELFALSIYCEKYLQPSLCLILLISQKITRVKDVPTNKYELPNIQDCSLIMFWNGNCAQSLVVSCKWWVVPLISTRVSDYIQVILLGNSFTSIGPFLWGLTAFHTSIKALKMYIFHMAIVGRYSGPTKSNIWIPIPMYWSWPHIYDLIKVGRLPDGHSLGFLSRTLNLFQLPQSIWNCVDFFLTNGHQLRCIFDKNIASFWNRPQPAESS